MIAGFEDFEAADGSGAGGIGGTSGTGATGGAAASAGSAGKAGQAGNAGTGPLDCPDGTWPGSQDIPMVHVHGGDGSCFWIDKTEVSREDYDAFLATSPSLPSTVPCDWKTSLEPACPNPADAGADAGTDPASPVVCVDWCDAQAFCAFHGRTLCHGSYVNVAIAKDSDWFAACSHGGENAYPYGAIYDDELCNGLDHSGEGVLPATGQASCATAEGALNMSGNVWEWVDECDDASGESDSCNLRGGSFKYDAQNLACRAKIAPDRNARSDEYGFRCCAYD